MIKDMNTDRGWLLKMAAEEDGAIVSVGGLVIDLSEAPDDDQGPEPDLFKETG